jgi:osmotically-inducible protein OsmY
MHVQSQPNFVMPLAIKILAEARLQASPYPSIRKVVCVYEDGLLLLRGRLPTFFHKQLAQAAVADIVGVKQVVNQIEVLERAT